MQPTQFTPYQLNRQAYVLERINVIDRGFKGGACWEWTLSLKPHGYGSGGWRRANMGAYRVSYKAFVGEPPTGLDLDHLCFNRACVNPEHLEPVTRRENALRAVAHNQRNGTGRWVRLDTCRQGLHELSEENITYVMKGPRMARTCRLCNNERQRQFREANKDRLRVVAAERHARKKANAAA